MVIDTETGAEWQRVVTEEAEVVTMVEPHPYRQLMGAAFITLCDGFTVAVDDDQWEPVFGLILALPGGCELDVDDSRIEQALEDIEHDEAPEARRPELFSPAYRALLVPMVLRDADLPRARVLVPVNKLKECDKVEPGSGPHVLEATQCRHTVFVPRCRGCLWRQWTLAVKRLEQGNG